MIFQPEFETLERHALEALQLDRLRALVERLRDANGLYRERLRGVAGPAALSDLQGLPFSTKADLRDGYPLGLLAVPERELARVHASSGTTGNPTIGAYTRGDLRVFGEVNARSLAAGGIEPGQMFQVAWGYGLFTGGLGMHGGCEALGACAIPASSGNTARQMQLLADLPVVGIGATPVVRAGAGRALSQRAAPAAGAEVCDLRRRGVDARDAGRAGRAVRRDRDQHLRADRDHRPRRRARVLGQSRPARPGRPLPGRDRRPARAARRWPTASAASW